MKRVTVGAAVITAALLGGCAQPGSMPTASVTADIADTAGGRLLTEISAKMKGTAEQRAAGMERQHYAWQAALGACVTGKGAPFEVPPFTATVGRQHVSPGGLLGWSLVFEDFGLADRHARAAGRGAGDNPALEKLTGEAAADWVKMAAECDPATKATEELAVPNGYSPSAEACFRS
ncbi:hypothetical protein ACQPZJ_22215 [Actinoplanes sp. CA-054009]